MENASSHYDAKVALSKIMAHLLADKGAKPGVCQRLSVEVFYTLKWEVAFERYTLYWYIFVNPQIRRLSRGEVNGVTWNKTFVASKVKENCFDVKGTQVNVFITHVCSLLFTRTFSILTVPVREWCKVVILTVGDLVCTNLRCYYLPSTVFFTQKCQPSFLYWGPLYRIIYISEVSST